MKMTMAALAVLLLAGCAEQSVGPGGVDQSFGPFHQSVGPGGVQQGSWSGGPQQNVSPYGVQQSSGTGARQTVTPYGVSQSTGAAPRCDIECDQHHYAAACPAGERARCQCAAAPFAACVAAH